MKISRLSFITALLMTIAIAVIVVAFDYANRLGNHFPKMTFLLGVSMLLIFVITYFGIEILLWYYGKRQVRKMADRLPDEIFDDGQNIGFKEFSEKMFVLRQKTTTEIDTMKEMENYRKEYIGNISHELKTPLFSIQGYIEILKDGGAENMNLRDKYLERIGISLDRLIAIVNDLDMINRFEAGEIKLSLSRFDINALVREVFDLLELEAQKKNAVLKLLSPQTQIFVHADKQKISQVLINLLSNAVHYANRQEAKIVVNTNILNKKALIEVCDNGMGIKPELLPRIFERFYRVEPSRNRKDGGSGLGLPIVKHILKAHGENIRVESEYLEGTKFSFLLDRA
ncbi:MAG: ATP-binding protein [Bergeyella sp.]